MAYLVDATATLHELRKHTVLPLEESTQYNTLAGFLLHVLHTVPQPGVSVTAHGYTWTIVEMDGPRIAKVKVERHRV